MHKIIVSLFASSTVAVAYPVCSEFDDVKCNLYDDSYLKIASANAVEKAIRKKVPALFEVAGKTIRIKYLPFDNAHNTLNSNFAGYVNLQETIDSYAKGTAYTIHLAPSKSELEFGQTVAHEIGHILNLVCSISKLEKDYSADNHSLKIARITNSLQNEYFNDISKSHDDRRAEQIANSFKNLAMQDDNLPEEFLGDFCIE